MSPTYTTGSLLLVIHSTRARYEVSSPFLLYLSVYLTPSLEHNISGDVLCLLDPEGLKGVGIATIGQRLAILKAVYLLKIAHGVPIDSDHYVPPCELSALSLASD